LVQIHQRKLVHRNNNIFHFYLSLTHLIHILYTIGF